ncbi:MAG: hypothetical protein A2636_05290 [Elusimicrobia bacterium RIFCSPHIGHO2_01_FULL_64_10]|nr:MAG: hypothetical protein A2636_05290 [Elusimicrobia bacterium RIFCSPHIGHO2_01_FULL_64_10]
MRTRPLDTTGLSVSEICLGTMQFLWSIGEEDSHAILDAFFEAGGNFIDTADMYSQWVPGLAGGEAEGVIGRWMKKKRNRDRIVLATKVRCRMWPGPDGEGLGEKHVLRACDESLKRLQTDRIDLYQSHWPDQAVPIEETLGAYANLIRQGKVRFAGCSNYPGRALEEALAKSGKGRARTVSVQPCYNLLKRGEFEREILPIVRREGLAVIPYSPLAGGFLTGKYRRGQPLPKSVRAKQIRSQHFSEGDLSVVELLEKLSKDSGRTVAQTALAWILSHDWVTAPIIGATSLAQLRECLGAGGLKLAPAEKDLIDRATRDR